MVLGTNYPYGPEEGCLLVKNSLKAIDGLELDAIDKRKNSRRQRGEDSRNRSGMNFTKAARPVIMGQNGMVSSRASSGVARGGANSPGRRQRGRCRARRGVRHRVVKPETSGPGGDLFALVYMKKTGKVEALNPAARRRRKRASNIFASTGSRCIPQYGPLSIAVPGAVDGWLGLHEKYGT